MLVVEKKMSARNRVGEGRKKKAIVVSSLVVNELEGREKKEFVSRYNQHC